MPKSDGSATRGEARRDRIAMMAEARRDALGLLDDVRRDLIAEAKIVDDDRGKRILWIADVMSRNLWPVQPNGFAFRIALGEAWGLAEGSIRQLAVEGHRMVALDPDLRDQLQRELANRFSKIGEEALAMLNEQTGLPDFGAAIKAYELYGRYSGIELETKVKVTGTVSLEDVDELRKRLDGVVGGAAGGDEEG